MEVFEIEGGRPLSGRIPVSGLKNAATPIIAATLLTRETCTLHNIPRIEDVFRMLEIIESMGAEVKWQGEHTLSITARDLDVTKIDQEKVKRLRSSIFLLGALSARFDFFSLLQPGGCVIGARSVDAHLLALEKMGVTITRDEKSLKVDARGKKSSRVTLKEISVTATENSLLLAARLPGVTEIRVAACEPHVEDLGRMLQKMGATIEGLGTHTLRITGKEKLSGAEHTIIPDHNEAATFLILGVATKSPLTVVHAREENLDIVLEKLREFGADFDCREDEITVIPPQQLRAVSKIDTRTYPGIPSDVQSMFGVLATQATGQTLVFDTLYEGRFNYVSELEKMGAKATILNPHQVIIDGPTALRGTTIKSFDLRAGAALIVAALIATGRTVIEDIYQVDRGYERIEERLTAIGANIRRVTLN